MKVGVVGLGLIGGSMAKAFSEAGNTVFGADNDAAILEMAQLSGVTAGTLDPKSIPECELIIIALWPKDSVKWLEAFSGLVSKTALVIDCCGVKREVCEPCFELARKYGFTYVGGHPMAGLQNSGYKYSRSNLFKGAPMIIVPPVYDHMELLERVKQALEPAKFGKIVVSNAEEHDKMIAFTSQLAHVVSSAYIKSPTARQHRGFSAGSYKDMTRVAKLDERMWTELFLENADNLTYELDLIIEELTDYRRAISSGDGEKLCELLAEGRKRKEEVDG